MSFTPKLSVLLPTLRQHQAKECLESLFPACDGLDAEILVITNRETADLVAPQMPEKCQPPVIFLEREIQDGPIMAINYGHNHAAGDYLFILGDEDRMAPGSLKLLYEKAEAERAAGNVNIVFCPWECGAAWSYWNVVWPPFPFVHRDVVDGPLKGVLFDPEFKAHYCDPDLGQRCAVAGVEVRLCNDARIFHGQDNDGLHQHNANKYFAHDELTFRYRWGRNPDGTLKPWPSLSM